MGLLGGDLPDRQIAPLDPTSTGIINNQVTQGNNQGSIDKANTASAIGAGNSDFAKFGGGDSAIKQKYAGLLGQQQNDFSQGQNINSNMNQLSSLQRAQNAMMARTQVQNDIFSKNLQNQMAQEAARAQALQGILGAVGSGIGILAAKHAKNNTTASVDGMGEQPTQPQGGTAQTGYARSQNMADRMTPNNF